MGTPLNISSDLSLDLEEVIGQCIAILGIRGSGKSNTAGVIFEELLRHNYPMSIVDIEGEYFGLKEKYEVLVVGTGDGVEIEIDPDCAEEIAQVSIEKNVPVVLDLSGFLSDERTELLKAYLTSLWNLAGKLRRPYIIGIEEAHEFIPQGVKTELKEMIARIALRGRKRGLGAIIVSQRSAKVDKDVLSQAGILFLHRVVHEVDMRVYSELLPWKKSEVKEIIGSLETGDEAGERFDHRGDRAGEGAEEAFTRRGPEAEDRGAGEETRREGGDDRQVGGGRPHPRLHKGRAPTPGQRRSGR